MMVRLWVIDDEGKRLPDPSFLPLLLQWSWWVNDGNPSRWLERLPIGTFKHCDLLTVTVEEDARSGVKRRDYDEKAGRPKSWMTFKPAYDTSDYYGQNPLRKPPGRYELEFVAAASNATAIHRTAHISFSGWRDTTAEMFGENGGLNVRITGTENPGDLAS
jgi:hypothetical protein